MSFSPEEVDTERFIELVKAHPEIWDIGCEEHKDRRMKDAAWEKVARGILEDYEDKGEMEKNEIVKKFASKWRNIRDTYAKSEKKRSSIGRSSKVRRYIYAKQLAFLQYSTVPAVSQTNNENETEEAQPNEASEVRASEDNDVQSIHTTIKPKRRSIVTKHRKRAFESFRLKCQNQPSPADEPDEDRAFFDSLLPSVRKLNEDQKLDFRCEVLSVLKKIKQGSAYQVQLALSPQSYPQRQYRYLTPHNFTMYAQPSLNISRHKRTEKTPSHYSDSIGSNVSQSPTPSEWFQTSSEEE